MRMSYLAAALAAFSLAALAAGPASAGVGLGQQYPRACASGYHKDRGGNCQPNIAEGNRYCPTGTVYNAWFDGGWYCSEPPPEAY